MTAAAHITEAVNPTTRFMLRMGEHYRSNTAELAPKVAALVARELHWAHMGAAINHPDLNEGETVHAAILRYATKADTAAQTYRAHLQNVTHHGVIHIETRHIQRCELVAAELRKIARTLATEFAEQW